MKKYIILFLLNLLIPIVSFSQSIYPKILNDSLVVITPLQLKQTNLIFIEHKKYKLLIPQLENKITHLYKINSSLELIDSLKTNQIIKDSILITNNFNEIKQLNKKISLNKTKQKRLLIGSFSLTTLFGLLWLLK